MPRIIGGKYMNEASKVFQEGDDFWQAGSYDEAKEKYRLSAQIYEEKQDIEGEAFAFSRLGELELSLGNFETAEKALLAAADLVQYSDYAQNTYGEALTKLGKLEAEKGNTAKALDYFRQAKEVLNSIDNKNLLGDVYDQTGYVYLLEGKDKEALKAYMMAVKLYGADGVSLKEASVLRAIARIQMKNHSYDEAHDVLEKCRDLYRENGDLLGEASALSAIGCLRYIIKDIENARKALMKAVYLYGKATHHYAEAEALLYLARVEAIDRERGDFERAKAHYKRAIELFDFLGNDVMKKSVLEEYNNFLNRCLG